jgi:hypothetical protein
LEELFTNNSNENGTLNQKIIEYAFKKIKLSVLVNGTKLIPANLCLGDLGEEYLAIFTSEPIMVMDFVRINFPHNAFIVSGRVMGIREIKQYVIKANGSQVSRVIIKMEHQDNAFFNKKKILEIRSGQVQV